MITIETIEDKQKREALQSFRRGWKHGACSNARDPRFTEHHRADIVSAYQRGYQRGHEAFIVSGSEECIRLQYDPPMSLIMRGPDKHPPSPLAGDPTEGT